MGEPGRRVDLHDRDTVVPVDHQAGKAVVLSVHEPVGGRGGRLLERPAALDRSGEPGRPEVVVDRGGFPRVQDPHPYRGPGVPQADRREPPAPVEHHRQVAGSTVVAHRGDRRIEEPRMPTPDLTQCVGGDPHRDPAGTGPGKVDRKVKRQPVGCDSIGLPHARVGDEPRGW